MLKPERRFSWAWLLPLLALALATWLGCKAWSMRGRTITVQLDNGYGLKPGDEVRYRGIGVGKIDAVSVLPDLQGVLVSARLTSQSESLARVGSRFWVVRPQLHLTHVEGLETLVGPRVLAVLPGAPEAPGAALRRQSDFVGLSEAPIVESFQPGDLEIILQATQRGSLHAGAPITYRQTRVGTILSVGLAGDSSAVEARAHIEQPFVQLIRPQTRFWDVGGIQAKLGFTGVSIEVDSAEALLSGGVALATPPPGEAGNDIIRTGHRFKMVEKPDKDWLDWQPMIAIGSSLLPPGASPPSPLRATIGWKQGRWIKGQRSHQGWVLQTPEGLLGPADLLKPGEKADKDTVVLEVAGTIVPLGGPPVWERNGLALIKANVSPVQWPHDRSRKATGPEESLAIADSVGGPLPLTVSRLSPKNGEWIVDPAVPIDSSWHGACVVSRADGRLLGILLVDDAKGAKVALLSSDSE